jgi:Peptidase C13 family
MFHRLAFLLCFVLAACVTKPNPLPQPSAWKAVLIAGDDAEPAFDNAVDAMAQKIGGYGVAPQDMVVLKASAAGDRAANEANIVQAISTLSPTGAGGCFLFITSHGGSDRGLIMKAARKFLRPGDLDKLLDEGCGDRPTVVIASGCFSGIFAEGRSMPAANRTILTAARSDRTSFGCNANRRLTIFDECVLDSLDRGQPWQTVIEKTRNCVARYEQDMNVAPPSEPQISIGRNVENQLAF